jgi:hypothetical protein
LTKRQAVSVMPSVGLANLRENGVRSLAVQCHRHAFRRVEKSRKQAALADGEGRGTGKLVLSAAVLLQQAPHVPEKHVTTGTMIAIWMLRLDDK